MVLCNKKFGVRMGSRHGCQALEPLSAFFRSPIAFEGLASSSRDGKVATAGPGII